MSELTEIGLYDLIKGLRKNMWEILTDDEIQNNPLFVMKTVEIELNVILSKAGTGGVKFFLVPIEATAQYEKQTISKIKLSLEVLRNKEGNRYSARW